MKRSDRPLRDWLLIGGLLSLLPVLAMLQYRWVGQFSQAERERMQASMQTGAQQVVQALDSALTSLYFAFQDSDAVEAPGTALTRWSATAPYPRVLQGVYFVSPHDQALKKLSTPSGTWTNMPWPEHWKPLQARLAQHAGTDALHILPEVQFDLGVLIVTNLSFPAPPALDLPRLPGVQGWTILQLDREYLRGQLIPALVQQYLNGAATQKFSVAVVEKNSRAAVYESGAGVAEALDRQSDVQVNALRFLPDNLLRLSYERRSSGPALTQERVEVRRGKWSTGGAGSARDRRFAVMVRSPADWEGAWRLLVRHPEGSLQAAVTRLRWRNLSLSFGILLLLSVAMGLLLVSANRSQMLAKRQMEFVAGVSHELRTPLAVICSAGHNLSQGVVSDAARVQQYGAVIQTEGRRLSEMVEQVMAFAGIQSGRKTLELQTIDVLQVLDRALETCAASFQESRLPLEREVTAPLPPVRGDAAALSHCVQNLLINALKYAPDSSRVLVRAEAVDQEVRITVQDQGPGLDAADLPHLFEPFYRGRQVLASATHGLGLGLSFVSHIVAAHRGRVSARNVPGGGAAFTLHLPVHPV